jgi:phage baseplate assembly protein W
MTTTWYGMGKDRLEGGGSRDSSGREVIRAGIRRLLRTKPGEFLTDPRMGNMAFRYIHRPLTAGVLVLIGYSCLEVIARYEDRVRVNLGEDVPPVLVDDSTGYVRAVVEYQWRDDLSYETLGVRFPQLIGGDGVEFDLSN